MSDTITFNGITYRVPGGFNAPTDIQATINLIWAHFNQHHDQGAILMASSLVRTIKVLHKLDVI